MGARSSQSRGPGLNETDGHLLEYFRNTFAGGGGGTTFVPPPPSGLTATGGVISDYSDGGSNIYRAHIFTSSGTFDVSAIGNLPASVEYLVIGGGGGGAGEYQGGGGGAGGLRTNLSGHPLATGNPSFTVTAGPTSYTVTIGGGGSGAVTNSVDGNSGVDSYFGPPSSPEAIIAKGGGAAGGYNRNGVPGGSGGGSGDSPTGSTVTGGYGYNPSTPSPIVPNIPSSHPYGITQGNNGGAANGAYQAPYVAGGGGGAGGNGLGSNGDSVQAYDGNGGLGSQVLIAGPSVFSGVGAPGPNGQKQWYCGGGGGGGYVTSPSTSGDGGAGPATNAPTSGWSGGGPGGPNGTGATGSGVSGSTSSGGGGGGSVSPGPPFSGIGGSGGSGIVIVRYQIASINTTGIKATGGAISFAGDKTIHVFTSSGIFASTGTLNNIDCLVCGGGGSSQPGSSGGGGAGGIAYYPNMPIPNPSGNINVIVGGGGVTEASTAPNGTASTFHTTPSPYYLEGKGGGAGTIGAGGAGGSGGGSGYSPTSSGGATNQASPNPNTSATNYGSAGGASTGTGSPWNYSAGGGGGASSAGTAAASDQSGPGGNGIGSPTISWMPSTVGDGGYIGGGGGGGGSVQTAAGGAGGTGGGGDGFGNPLVPTPAQPYTATNGVINTGGGAGGTAGTLKTKGGSGIVLIAYPS